MNILFTILLIVIICLCTIYVTLEIYKGKNEALNINWGGVVAITVLGLTTITLIIMLCNENLSNNTEKTTSIVSSTEVTTEPETIILNNKTYVLQTEN